MERNAKPDINRARKVLPAPLFAAIQEIFQKKPFDTALVGGTALAGFYAGHRRSDDIDLFTKSEAAQKSAVLAVKSLKSLGANLLSEQESSVFYDSSWQHNGHRFTAQVVLDAGLYNVGSFERADEITVASLSTIFKMKAATLVSRCSEKDLFDLQWLFNYFPELQLADLIQSGFEIDAGVNAENMLASIAGTTLRAEACDFSLEGAPAEETYQEIMKFKKELKAQLKVFLKAQPTPELGKLVRHAKRVLK